MGFRIEAGENGANGSGKIISRYRSSIYQSFKENRDSILFDMCVVKFYCH